MDRFNSYVRALSPEDQERFWRETRHNTWYRETLSKFLDAYVEDLVREEEADDAVRTVPERRAARKLQQLLRISDGK